LTGGVAVAHTATSRPLSTGGVVPSPSTQFRAVLFDFDGTLADSYPAIAASVNHVRASHDLPPLPVAEVKRHVGRGPAYLLRNTCPAGDVEENVAAYRAHHPSVLREGTHLLPGVFETLQTLHANGLLLGVCSNKPVAFTNELVQILSIAPFLSVVLGPEDAGAPKPAPDILLLALARLRFRADEALYVGDMTVDVQTARAAGVTVWIVPTGSDEIGAIREAKPDRLLARMTDVLALLGRRPPA
jgi:phosphoglycolate phosphatase